MSQPVEPNDFSANSGGRPEISVVIPLYQKKDYILRALDSALGQDYMPAEIIIIDDGSTDGAADLVEARNLDKVKVFRQKNAGAAAARNQAIRRAKSRYVAFLDADDTWASDHLAEIVRLINEKPDAVIFGTAWTEFGHAIVDSALPVGISLVDLTTYLRRSAENQPPYWTSATAIDKATLSEKNLFETGSRIGEDQDAWITMLKVGAGAKSSKVTAHYNVDEKNPTIAKPSAADFESVIFQKWNGMLHSGNEDFREFVAVHQLYTIERHASFERISGLWARATAIQTHRYRARKYKLLIRLGLNSIRDFGRNFISHLQHR